MPCLAERWLPAVRSGSLASWRTILGSASDAGHGTLVPPLDGIGYVYTAHTYMCTADEALARLKAGNERFARGRARFPTVRREVLAALAKGPQPYATIIGCSDSRVPPELLFDAGFGELFIVRVAGNVISPEVMGSLQYAAVHLHTPLFVVLGPARCGAVQAALARQSGAARERSHIEMLLARILPGLEDLDPRLDGEARLAAA